MLVDSYRVRADEPSFSDARIVVAIDDIERDLAVDLVIDPVPGAPAPRTAGPRRVLAGAPYALVPPPAADVVEVAVDASGRARARDDRRRRCRRRRRAARRGSRRRLPDAEVRLVVGPWGASEVPVGVVPVHAPDGLAAELAAASVVVTAGGVTMLEACLLGRPVVALALAENQRQAVHGLEREHAVVVATPDTVAGAVGALAGDRSRRIALAAAARSVVDGKGATRVVDMLEQLVSK